jgi:hypothetical protein
MKRFLQKVALYVLILFVLSLGGSALFFACIAPQYRYNYNASVVEKMERLESPKIILVGNSNLAFGIDSAKIQQEMGMPVVNLGLHGGMSNAFHENMAKGNIGEGDIVVVCHTTYSDNGKIDDYPLAWLTVENHLEYLRLLPAADYWDMLCAYPNYVWESVKLWATNSGNTPPKPPYSRLCFNEYGDVATPRNENKMVFRKGTVTVPNINDNCTERLNAFWQYCRERGADMVVAGYPIASGEFTPPQEDYVAFQKRLDDKLDCDIISDFTDYFIDYRYFYDTKYHLTDEGVAIRTEQLITDLKRWQQA